tara:strand:- start:344 stop:4066 length:3723 start_codon:yes stop_codon:yes gene_type:complete
MDETLEEMGPNLPEAVAPTAAPEPRTAEQPLPFMTFDKPELSSLMGVFNNDVGAFARNMSEVLNEQFDDQSYLTYEGLRTGTAPVFEMFPSFKELPPEQRRLSNEQIISLFAFDPEGNPIEGGTFLQGMGREAVPQAGALGGFMAGMQAGNLAVAGVPPVSPPTAAIRVGVPLLAGIAGSILGYTGGEKVTDALLGEERPMLPGQTAAYEAGKTTMGALAWLPLPFMIPKTVNMGVAAVEAALAPGARKALSTRAVGGIENVLGKMGTAAATAPIATVAAETVAGLGAGAGAYLAEELAPGQAVPRLAAEFGGGVSAAVTVDLLTSRLRMLGQGASAAVSAIRTGDIQGIAGSVRGRRETQVINYMLDMIDEAGEDPEEIIRKLSSNEFFDVMVDEAGNPINLTAALKSGSPALLALEKSLEKLTTGVGRERASANVQATRALRNTINALYASNDPQAIQEASVLAESVFSAGMEQDLASAYNRVFDAYTTVRGDVDPTGRQAALGENLQAVLKGRLSAARMDERRLWADVPRGLTVDTFLNAAGNPTDTPRFLAFLDNNVPATKEALDDILPGISPLMRFARRKRTELGLDPVVPLADGSLPDAPEVIPLSVQEIYDMRSTALSKAKESAAAGKTNEARIAFGFADAILEDLDNFQTDNIQYSTARAYSRALNDSFTRSFAGAAIGKTRTGAQKIAPEQLANDIFQSDAGYLRLKQLDQVGQFELTQALTNLSDSAGNPDLSQVLENAMASSLDAQTGLVNVADLNRWVQNNDAAFAAFPDVKARVLQAAETTTSIRGTTEQILRNIRAQAFNPDTGEVNVGSLRKWMEKPENQDVLSAMPALKADLEDVDIARTLLDGTVAANRAATRDVKATVSFMDLLPATTENPATAAGKAISEQQKRPVQSWNALLNVVEKAPETWTNAAGVVSTRAEAMEGLRSSFMEAAMVRAGGSSQTFSARSFYDTIFAAHRNSEGKVSLSEWMLDKNVMGKPEMDRLQALSKELVKMETFVATGDMGLEELAETVGPMMDFYLRIAGASAGSNLQRMMPGDSGGGSLIAAGAGSKAFRSVYAKVFAGVPESMKMDVMTQALKDPELLATMLSRGRTVREQTNIAGRLGELLLNKGLLSVAAVGRRGLPAVARERSEAIYDQEPELPVAAPPVPQNIPPPNQQGAAMPPAPPAPRPVQQAAAQPAPPPAPPAASGPVDRSRFAAFFPYDPTTDLIRQQAASGGIGSLMGQ